MTHADDRVDVWTLQLQDPLPTIPIPLLPPDLDIPLKLSDTIAQVYEEIVGATGVF